MFLNISELSASNVLKIILNVIVSIGCTFVLKKSIRTNLHTSLTFENPGGGGQIDSS